MIRFDQFKSRKARCDPCLCPVTRENILEAIAVIEAARLAQKERRRVKMSEVWDRSASWG